MTFPAMFFNAWVDATETTFGPQHEVVDEDIVSFRLEQTEGNSATLELDVRNPKIGLLAPGRKVWLWFSYDSGTGGVVPLFFGRLVGVPTNMLAEVVTLSFIAKPLDFITQKFELAEVLKQLPYYDPIFVDPDKRPYFSTGTGGTSIGDPDVVLEGYSALWHIDRLTGQVTISDIINGEDGTLVFSPTAIPYDSVSIELGQPPLTSVQVTGDVSWGQAATGTIDFGQRSFDCWTGGSIVSSWPKTGAQLSGGWSVNIGTAVDVYNVQNSAARNLNFHFENREKKHNNGDIMSISQSWTEFPSGGHMYISGLEQQAGVIPSEAVLSYDSSGKPFDPYAGIDNPGDGILSDFDEPAPNIPLHMAYHQTMVMHWLVNTNLVLDYKAGDTRKENVLFTLSADLQSIVTLPDPTEALEQISISGADVGTNIDGIPPIVDTARNLYFSTDRGQLSLQYLISVARSHILMRARAINISWQCDFDNAVLFTLRKNATISDNRLPGGVASGKITSYFLTGSGDDGTLFGGCTIGCAIGHDGTVAAAPGTETWVEPGWVEPGWQVMQGQTTALASGDIAYELPIPEPTGLIYPLTKEQVLVDEHIDISELTDPVLVGTDKARYPSRGDIQTYVQFPITSYYLELKAVTGNLFATPQPANVSVLKVPKQIDLEAPAITA
jgi:hypothetical protein